MAITQVFILTRLTAQQRALKPDYCGVCNSVSKLKEVCTENMYKLKWCFKDNRSY